MLHLVGLTLLATCNAVLLRRAWRHSRTARLGGAMLPVAAAVVALSFHLIWPGEGAGERILAVRIMSGCFVVMAAMLPALFLSWLLLRRLPRPGHEPAAVRGGVPDPSRRRLLAAAAAAVPLLAAGSSAAGIVGGSAPALVFRRRIAWPGLPEPLDGLRVLHLSDLHLGSSLDLPGLDLILRRAAEMRPDLVAVTGDVADDPDLLPAALDLIDSFGAPLGAYATLGNHEYGHGLDRALAAYADGPVPLLRDRGLLINGPRGDFWLAGADDPAGIAADLPRPEFYRRCLARATAGRPAGSPVLLLAHRPDIHALAARAGSSLTLCGHTHGGQIGLGGRSLFDPPWDRNPIWGVYPAGDGRLHVTAGAGQWFPFRLGCPAEAPVLELARG